MITPYHKEYLSKALAMWSGSADNNHVPDTVRNLGVVVEDDNTLRCFIAEKFSDKFIENIKANKQIAFAASDTSTFETYQYKGEVLEILPATAEEVELQRKYMDIFSEWMGNFGLDKQSLFNMYFYQPSVAIRFKVVSVFDQSPKKNTGGEILK